MKEDISRHQVIINRLTRRCLRLDKKYKDTQKNFLNATKDMYWDRFYHKFYKEKYERVNKDYALYKDKYDNMMKNLTDSLGNRLKLIPVSTISSETEVKIDINSMTAAMEKLREADKTRKKKNI